MEYIEKVGDNWFAQPVEYDLRKVDIWGNPYRAIGTFKVVDGEAHFEGLLAKDGEFTTQDKSDIEDYIKSKGFEYYVSSYYDENNVRVTVTTWLTPAILIEAA